MLLLPETTPASSSLLLRRQNASRRGTPTMRLARLALFLTASSAQISRSAPVAVFSPRTPTSPILSPLTDSSRVAGNSTSFETGFTEEPYRRGTVGLIATCFLTMLISVWTVLHTNIPPLNQPRYIKFLTKALWLFEGLLYPEELLSIALSQRAKALRFCRLMNRLEQERKFGKLDKTAEVDEDWNVGGEWAEVLRSLVPEGWFGNKGGKKSQYNEYRHWPLSVGFYATTGGFAYVDPNTYPPPPTFQQPAPATMGPTTILRLAQSGHFLEFHVRDIESRSKRAMGGYFLISLQSLFLLSAVLTRILASRPFALLELHALIHVVFAMLTGLVWRGKQRGVERPTIIPGRHLAGHEKLLRRGIPGETKMAFSGNWTVLVPLSALYAGLHALAWPFTFPTEAEQVLWRLAIIVTVSGAILIAALLGTGKKEVPAITGENWRKFGGFQMLGFMGVWVIFFVVTLARTVFVVESCFQLRSLEKGVYELVNWTAYIPHL